MVLGDEIVSLAILRDERAMGDTQRVGLLNGQAPFCSLEHVRRIVSAGVANMETRRSWDTLDR